MNGLMSLIEIVWEWADAALRLAIDAGICAAVIAAVVVIFNILLRRWLSARQMGLLWGVVLLRLLVPFAPSSSLSLQNVVLEAQANVSEFIAVESEPKPATYDYVSDSPSMASTARSNPQSASTPETAPIASFCANAVELFIALIPLLWLLGGCAYLVWITVTHWLFCSRLKRVPECHDSRTIDIWEACCSQANVRTKIPVVLSERVEQPAILGLFRPKLLLPTVAMQLNDQQLRMVMFHELAHVRRRDIAVNWLLVVIRAIHWWNPVYWLAATRMQSLREQSCDDLAIRWMEGHPIRGYSELLLQLAERQPPRSPWKVMLPASMLGFLSSFFRKRAVCNRLKALRTAGVVRSRRQSACVAVLLALVALCGMTDANPPAARTEQPFDRLPRDFQYSNWAAASRTNSEPSVTRTYDVEKALQRITADETTEENARLNLYWTLIQILRTSSGRYQELTNEWAQERVALKESTLTVIASLDVHAEILRNLKAWEQSGLAQTCLHIQLISDNRDIASTVGVSWQFMEAFSGEDDVDFPAEATTRVPVIQANASVNDYLPLAVATLTDQQAAKLLRTAQESKESTVVSAPKVTVFNGQQATVQDCSQRPFVVGIQHDSAGVPQPKVIVIDEGLKLTFRTIRSSDDMTTQLAARITLSQIGDVHEASTLLRGKPTTIQIPRVNRCRIDVSSAVPDGQSLLIGCIPAHDRKQYFYVLMTVRHINLAEEERSASAP